MKLLLDHNLSPRLKRSLGHLFEEVVHVSDLSMSQALDPVIWQFARDHGFALMSKDGDFADMALLYGSPPKVIRLRIGNGPWRSASDVFLDNEDAVREFLGDTVSSLLVLSK